MPTPPSRAERGNHAYVQQARGKLRYRCHICDAEPGFRCQVWKVEKGERLYVLRTQKTPHRERGRP